MAKTRKTPEDDAAIPEEDVKSGEIDESPDETEASKTEIEPLEDAGQSPPENEDSAAARPPRRSGVGFLALVLGGGLAAIIGFGAARYVVPEGWPFPGVAPEVDPLAAAVEVQADRLGVLEATAQKHGDALAALQSDPGLENLGAEFGAELAALQARLTDINARMAGIETRLSTVEKLPQGAGSEAAAAAAAAYERDLAQMRAMLDEELARIGAVQADAQTMEANAAQAARAATGRAALARVLAALDTGQPFGEALSEMSAATGVAVPDALNAMAADGVPTLAGLQAGFPDAARASLEAAILAAVDDGSMNRVSAFLRTQLGARSLEPKEGDDPDAILSRAEGALRQGQIDDALVELETLPDAGKPAMADWIALATKRLDALAAGETLARQLNSN